MPTRPAVPAGRDLTLDLVRVVCVLLVVVVHLLLAGVRLGDGGLELEKTLELQRWFNPVSFVFQVMPAFFVVGGFAAMTGWDSLAKRVPGAAFADRASAFVRVRLARLARPSLAVLAFFVAVLWAAPLLGAPADLVAGVASGVGSPLWFLAAYMIAQAAAPWLIRAHRARPVLAIVALAGAAVLFDALRYSTGIDLLALPNVAFVWLAAHQLGFWFKDGWFDRRRPMTLVGIVAFAYVVCIAMVWAGPYSWNMLENQFPPTAPLVLFALAQAALLRLARPLLSAIMRRPAAQAAVFLAGSRLMTIYLWHLPVIMALIGLQLLAPHWLSEPGSGRWWLERIPFYLVVLAAVWVLSLALVRLEAAPAGIGAPRIPGLLPALSAAAAFVVGPSMIMVQGLSLTNGTVALVGCILALALISGRAPAEHRRRRPRGAARAPETA